MRGRLLRTVRNLWARFRSEADRSGQRPLYPRSVTIRDANLVVPPAGFEPAATQLSAPQHRQDTSRELAGCGAAGAAI